MLWDQIKQRVGERDKPLVGLLAKARLDAVEDNTLVVGVADAIQESLMRPRSGVLEAALSDVLRVPMRVAIRVSGPGGPGRSAKSGHRAAPQASPPAAGGEFDLMAYARKKLGGTETT
jgi:hypothetical protein